MMNCLVCSGDLLNLFDKPDSCVENWHGLRYEWDKGLSLALVELCGGITRVNRVQRLTGNNSRYIHK